MRNFNGYNRPLKEAVNLTKLVGVIAHNPTQGIWKDQQTWSFACSAATLCLRWS